MRADQHPYFDLPFAALAHRGGSVPSLVTVGKENTLLAFRSAVELGYTYLETDVHATRDGHLVAFHDDILDRVTDRSGRIADLDLASVRRGVVGGTEQIPTLDEVFESFPDARFNIDIKSDAATEPLVDAITRHRAQQRVCVGSFGTRRLHRFRRLMGRQVATSASRIGIGWSATVPQVPRWLGSGGAAFQLPITHEIRGVTMTTLTDRLISSAHHRGMVVHVWTINDADTMRTLIDRGVDGIVSDRIDILKDVLASSGRWV